jgi:dTDP-4-dehydrorhamnose reductase
MRILVTGGSGLVGWEILMRAEDWVDCWFTYHSSEVQHSNASGRQLDIRNRDATRRLIERIDPNVIIHSAALTDVDACEINPDKAREINVDGVENVLAGASNTDSHIVFLSSSFVFDGSNHPHNLDDPHNPINVYGQTKADAEKLIKSADVGSAIVRTDQPYGWSEPWQSPTMVEWTLEQLSKEGSVEIFDDWYNIPTYLPDLAAAIIEISKSKLTGVFHIVGQDYVNRYEWALRIADVFEYDTKQIDPVRSSDSNLPAVRPEVYLKGDSHTGSAETKTRSISDGLEKMKTKVGTSEFKW